MAAPGEIISVDFRVSTGDYLTNPATPMHWRNNRDLSGNNVMSLGIWYEGMMRWVGAASSAFATGQVVVPYRKDEQGSASASRFPITSTYRGHLQQGGQYRLTVSSVIGHAPKSDRGLCPMATRVRSPTFNRGAARLSVGSAEGRQRAQRRVDRRGPSAATGASRKSSSMRSAATSR